MEHRAFITSLEIILERAKLLLWRSNFNPPRAGKAATLTFPPYCIHSHKSRQEQQKLYRFAPVRGRPSPLFP